MLDDLLGRTALKDRIEELEATVESLESQLEAEQRRRSEAATDRQEAERQVNRLEDKIAQLEDELDRHQSEETTASFRRESRLLGTELDEVLSRLGSFETGPEGALTAYVPDGHDLQPPVTQAFGQQAGLVSRAAPCLALADDAGLIRVCLRPPVAPSAFTEWSDSFRIERSWFRPSGRYTLALVRSDLFAMGTYQGDERTAFHGFDSDLKSQHSKGGFSQARFERLRDEQIDTHLDRCREALEACETDRLYVVGEGSVLDAFEEDADVTAAVDATGEPETALGTAWRSFWTVDVRVV